jgi:hypothetical protein
MNKSAALAWHTDCSLYLHTGKVSLQNQQPAYPDGGNMHREAFRKQTDVHGGTTLRRARLKKVPTQRQASRSLLHCQVYYSGINVQGRGDIRNLSLGGCQIDGGVAVRPATKLPLVLALPNGYAPVVVDRTIVVWSDGNRFGLRHELLLPKDRTQIERLLDDSDTKPQLPVHETTS